MAPGLVTIQSLHSRVLSDRVGQTEDAVWCGKEEDIAPTPQPETVSYDGQTFRTSFRMAADLAYKKSQFLFMKTLAGQYCMLVAEVLCWPTKL